MPENPLRVTGVRQSPRSVRHASVTETVLYSFGTNGGSDGADPDAGLTYFKGTLYGTTSGGGVSCHDLGTCGTVYRITLSGTERVLYRFKGGEDGASPLARLIVRNGTLYGTTFDRGECGQGDGGCGTVFSITPSGQETVLHEFAGSPDGRKPEARLLNVNGTLYGTTSYGGAYNSVSYGGTVFSVTPSGKEKVLHSFGNGADGALLVGGLIDVKGTLYGTTWFGGAHNAGTVFSITPGGKEKVVYSFGAPGQYCCWYPSGLADVNGTLYGTTFADGAYDYGTVFSITPSGKETLLHSFSGGDGAYPEATLLNVNGTLYGTTAAGGNLKCQDVGSPGGCGTVFKFDIASGHETVLYSFMGHGSGGSGQDGAAPVSGLIDVNGTFYGTTSGDGAYNGGTVYSITP
jgi:uncharacterized repeat protein (TIGR03803 family)